MTERRSEEKDLVQIIRDNPGCVAIIDNDHWSLHKQDPCENPHQDDEAYDAWDEANKLAQADEVKRLGSGYGSGNCYGGDILQALAVIVGIKVESV
jgi:hypothetical protein